MTDAELVDQLLIDVAAIEPLIDVILRYRDQIRFAVDIQSSAAIPRNSSAQFT